MNHLLNYIIGDVVVVGVALLLVVVMLLSGTSKET